MSKTLTAFWTLVVAGVLGGLTGASVHSGFGLMGVAFGLAVGAVAAGVLILATRPETRLAATPIVLGAVVISWLLVAALSPIAQLVATSLALGVCAVAVWSLTPIDHAPGSCPGCGYPSATSDGERICIECGVPRARAAAQRRARWMQLFGATALGIGLGAICGRMIG